MFKAACKPHARAKHANMVPEAEPSAIERKKAKLGCHRLVEAIRKLGKGNRHTLSPQLDRGRHRDIILWQKGTQGPGFLGHVRAHQVP